MITLLLCVAIVSTIHLQESFEGDFPPEGWTVLDLGVSGYTWESTSDRSRTGSRSAVVFYGPQGSYQNEWLVTPAIDLSGATQALLFFYEDAEYWEGYGDHHRIRVSISSPTDTATFSIVGDMTPQNHTIEGFDGDPVEIDLSSYAGQTIYIAFQYTGDWADDWYIDDIMVHSPSDHDVGVENIVSPSEFVFTDSSYTPEVKIRNWGLSQESFYLYLEILMQDSTLYLLDSAYITDFSPGAIQNVQFSPVIFTSGNSYNVYAYTALPGDEDPSNDTASSVVNAWSMARRPLVEMITNTGCPPCKPADDTLDHIVESLGDSISVIRYHAWWPDASDPFYNANISENSARINYYGSDYTPHLWIDGTMQDGEYMTSEWRSMVENELQIPTVIEMWVSGEFDSVGSTGILFTSIHAVDPLPYTDLRIRYAVIENDIYYEGSNGSLYHHQTFRDMFPDVSGIAFSIAQGSFLSDTQSFSIADDWVTENCEIVIFIQDDETKHVIQSVLLSIGDLIGVSELRPTRQVLSFQVPSLVRDRVQFNVTLGEGGDYEVAVYTVAGRFVWKGPMKKVRAGSYTLEMETRQIGSGTYFAVLKKDKRILKSRKFVIVR